MPCSISTPPHSQQRFEDRTTGRWRQRDEAGAPDEAPDAPPNRGQGSGRGQPPGGGGRGGDPRSGRGGGQGGGPRGPNMSYIPPEVGLCAGDYCLGMTGLGTSEQRFASHGLLAACFLFFVPLLAVAMCIAVLLIDNFLKCGPVGYCPP